MLQTHGLTCERNDRLLFQDVSFSVSPGEMLRVEGGNGAGKTTLLKILCGLYQDFDGTVEWDLPDFPLYVGHKPGVKDQLTAFENLRWLASLYQDNTSDADVKSALDRVGLDAYADQPCGAMSEGQRKRVNLARLYLMRSPAWILDEPFSSIDVAGVEELQQQMAVHLDTGGMILLTSHQGLTIEAPVKRLMLGGA